MTTLVSEVFKADLADGRRQRESVEFGVAEANRSLGLLDVWGLAKRRIRTIATVVIGCTLLATIAAFTLPKTYTATSGVVLERKDVRPFATDASLQSLDRDRSAAETEMDILQSRQFAGRVVDRLELVKDSNFNPYARSVKERNRGTLAYLRQLAGLHSSSTQSEPPAFSVQRDRAISALLSRYDVARTGESLAVRIVVWNQRPELAEKIANAIATMYVESSLEIKQDERVADKQRAITTGGAVSFLRQSIAQPLLQTLRSEEARLEEERAELAANLGENHPKIVNKNSQISTVRKMTSDEVQRILLDLEVESLKPSARIVSLAEVPNSPSFPVPGIIIPAAFAGSTVLAFLLALMLDAADTRIRSGRQTSQLLQIPNLGYLPEMPRNKLAARPGSVSDRQSVVTCTEADRANYLACRSFDDGMSRRIVMVAPCLERGASTSTAWGIAMAAAADGRATMFVDFDLQEQSGRVRTRAKRSHASNGHYLDNHILLAEVLQKGQSAPGFSFTDATRAFCDPDLPFNSKRFLALLSTINERGYQFIVVHTPPVLSAGDASWLAPFVDGVILTATWGKTTETHLADAALQLRMNRAVLIGTVIDQVNVSKHVSRGYGGFIMTADLGLSGNIGQARFNGASPRPDPVLNDSLKVGLNLRP
jgi:uncharacterized protein involved in exopolysaccharide biosynthesis/Mrp family chromosome partitioning ATPase